jgi:hypothetical protein
MERLAIATSARYAAPASLFTWLGRAEDRALIFSPNRPSFAGYENIAEKRSIHRRAPRSGERPASLHANRHRMTLIGAGGEGIAFALN